MHTEKELIDGCRKGKVQYQEALYKHFYAFAMSVCLRYASNRDDALEIVNDSFMKVFRNIENFDTSRPFKTWFRRILVNTSLDHYRANKKFQLHTDYDTEYLAGSIDPSHEIRLEVNDILKLFGRIPEIQRMVFNLYEVEGYSHDEIAGMLDIAPGTSRSHLSRAKKKLEALYYESQKVNNEAV